MRTTIRARATAAATVTVLALGLLSACSDEYECDSAPANPAAAALDKGGKSSGHHSSDWDDCEDDD